MGSRCYRAAALVVASLAWLPRPAGAGPFLLELDRQARRLDGGERGRVVRLLADFAAAVAADDSAAFAARFDTDAAARLVARAADSTLAYPEPLGVWLRALRAEAAPLAPAEAAPGGGWAGLAAAHEALRHAFVAAPTDLLPPATVLALVRADSLHALPLHLRPGLQPLRLAHKGVLDPDPRLSPLLLVSLRTAIPWHDPRCAPWRVAVAPGGESCPVLPGALPLALDPWAGPAAREALLDSLFANEPALAELGWLKRRFVRKGIAGLLTSLARQQAAFAECRYQRGAGPAPLGPPPGAGAPPRCALGEAAILRLLLLPDGGEKDRWRLVLAWLTPLTLADFATASLEPGYGDWLGTYSEWMASVEND
ncbi:hypothetical protein FJ251_04830 [bacterium]|nr:hypothetical protein [bacterium]